YPIVYEILVVSLEHDHRGTITDVAAHVVNDGEKAALLAHRAQTDDGVQRIRNRKDREHDRAYAQTHTEPIARTRAGARRGETERDKHEQRERAHEKSTRDPDVIGNGVGLVEIQDAAGCQHDKNTDDTSHAPQEQFPHE